MKIQNILKNHVMENGKVIKNSEYEKIVRSNPEDKA